MCDMGGMGGDRAQGVYGAAAKGRRGGAVRRRSAAVLNANAARSGGDRALQILRDAHRDMAGLDAQAPCRSPFSSSQWTLATNGGKRQRALCLADSATGRRKWRDDGYIAPEIAP